MNKSDQAYVDDLKDALNALAQDHPEEALCIHFVMDLAYSNWQERNINKVLQEVISNGL